MNAGPVITILEQQLRRMKHRAPFTLEAHSYTGAFMILDRFGDVYGYAETEEIGKQKVEFFNNVAARQIMRE